MSLMCPMAKCKEKQGMCNCEKAMSAVVVLAAIALIAKHFI